MDNFGFNIEEDTLFLNKITNLEQPNTFQVEKVPILNKEAFQTMYKEWIIKEGKDVSDTAAK